MLQHATNLAAPPFHTPIQGNVVTRQKQMVLLRGRCDGTVVCVVIRSLGFHLCVFVLSPAHEITSVRRHNSLLCSPREKVWSHI